MRTTLNIEDSVLMAAKELAYRQGKTLGSVISTLVRQAMLQETALPKEQHNAICVLTTRHGFRPFPASGNTVVSNTMVDKLRNKLGI